MLRLASRIWFPDIIFWKAAAARRTTLLTPTLVDERQAFSVATWSLVTVHLTFASLDEIDSARARRRPLVSPILEKLQINHFVGSHAQGFTPLR